MANDPNVNWPTQTNPPTPAYPRGSSKSVVVPGDDTGTPFDEQFVNDDFGLKQGILLRSGINPSGIPDTAEVSQYINGLSKMCGRASTTTVALATLDCTNAEFVVVNGYAAIGDGGHAVWYSDGVPANPAKAGFQEFNIGKLYDGLGNSFVLTDHVRNPRQFGAVGDGAANDRQAIQDAINSLGALGGGHIYFSPGTYKCLSALSMGTTRSFQGESKDTVTLTFDGAAEGSFSDGYCISARGSAININDLAADVDAGDTALTFVAPHGLDVDDIVIVLDPTNSSFSAAQTYYRAGEMVRVGAEDGASALTATRGLFAGYDSATVNLAKFNPITVAFSGLNIVGLGTTENISLIGIEFGLDCSVRDCSFSGTQATGLYLSRCYGVEVEGIVGRDMVAGAVRRHMVSVFNCQRVALSGLRGTAASSFVRTGGADDSWAVPCRDVALSDSHTDDSVANDLSVTMGGGSEFWSVRNCTLGGVMMGGNRGSISDCVIYGTGGGAGPAATEGRAVGMNEAHGADFEIANCHLIATRDVGSSVGLLDLDDDAAALAITGTTIITGCRLDMSGFDGLALEALSRVVATTANVSMVACVCQGGSKVRFGMGLAGSTWGTVSVRSCDFDTVTLEVQGAELVDVSDCRSLDAPGDGISIIGTGSSPYSDQHVMITGCQVRRAGLACIQVSDATATTLVHAHITGCVAVEADQTATASADKASFSFTRTREVVMRGNTVGDGSGAILQAASYYASAVQDLTDIDTLTLGGLSPAFVAVVNQHTYGARVLTIDDHKATGTLSLKGGNVGLAGLNSDGLIIGSGSGSQGMTIRSGATSFSRLTMSDNGDANRFYMEADHTAKDITFGVNGAEPVKIVGGGVEPGGDAMQTLGTVAKRWWRFFTETLDFTRMYVGGSKVVLGADIVVVWSNGTAAVSGVDGCVTVAITQTALSAGTRQFVYTFKGGAYEQIPHVVLGLVLPNNAGPLPENIRILSVTTTACTVLCTGPALAAGEDCRMTLQIIGERT